MPFLNQKMAISKNSDAFKFQRKLMLLTGSWPRRDASIFYRVYGAINYGMVLACVLPLLIGIMVMDDVSQQIQAYSIFVACINCCGKFTIFYFKRPAFLDLLDFLHSPHFSYHNEQLDHYLQRAIKMATVVVKLYSCSGSATILSIFLAPVFAPEGSRAIPFPFAVDVKQHSFLVYFLIYFYQCVAVSSAVCTSIGFDNLSTSMMGLCSAYFAILRKTIVVTTKDLCSDNKMIDNISKYKTCDWQIHEDLQKCVEHHLAVIKFTEDIENIFSYAFLCQFVCSAGGICLTGFTFMNAELGSVDFIFALTFLGTLLFQITLYCSYGDQVTVQSSLVLEACYMTEWVCCGPRVRKSLFLMMERSKRPMVLTAGKFINLSLSSLVAVVKSAASYAMVLYQLYNK